MESYADEPLSFCVDFIRHFPPDKEPEHHRSFSTVMISNSAKEFFIHSSSVKAFYRLGLWCTHSVYPEILGMM